MDKRKVERCRKSTGIISGNCGKAGVVKLKKGRKTTRFRVYELAKNYKNFTLNLLEHARRIQIRVLA